MSFLKITYDEDFDHFLIQGSAKYVTNTMIVTSHEAYKVLNMYFEQMLHEVELKSRDKRKSILKDL